MQPAFYIDAYPGLCDQVCTLRIRDRTKERACESDESGPKVETVGTAARPRIRGPFCNWARGPALCSARRRPTTGAMARLVTGPLGSRQGPAANESSSNQTVCSALGLSALEPLSESVSEGAPSNRSRLEVLAAAFVLLAQRLVPVPRQHGLVGARREKVSQSRLRSFCLSFM
ncbi:unnamed protein product [Protopolystoma xenopodis]|uniref:Uncharacterized protein n=1 Tax=Protopolystoma xenopodis TaxID=117903 RepID=A0A3S5CN58_9PLAT|nr:unnamed protein product [Protopolystoma xenopodis]